MYSKSPTILLISLYFFLLILSSNISIATDTISRGQSISGNQTIISRGGVFELGFFTPGNSHKYYIGIWYKKIPVQTVIWVANREAPVSDTVTSQLKLTEDGNLVLYYSRIPVWSSNTTSSSSFMSNIAVLLDTGNLVQTDQSNSSSIFWQSFDHPTDTLVPIGWLGMNKVTGEYQRLVSWKNSEDPAPGVFTDTIDPSGINQFILLWNNSKTYWSSGPWNGRSFSLLPAMDESSTSPKIKFVDDDKRRYFTTTLSDDRILARYVMSLSGQVQYWMWLEESLRWEMFFELPVSPCDVYFFCGAFGICDETSKPASSCLYGFSPASKRDWELNAWSSGCTRNTPLHCGDQNLSSGEKDGFLAISDVQMQVGSQPLAANSREECESACLKNCSCTAYAYESGCSIWEGDIHNLRRISNGDNKAGTLYLRLAASELQKTSGEGKSITKFTVSAIVGIMALTILVLFWVLYKRDHGASTFFDGPLVPFTYSDMQRMTKNFSEYLGGGGFGSVFKGALSDSVAVAVKRLEGIKQGEKEFRNELRTLGRIQHVNLVRLRGFCCEGTERMLVYDYMPKGSLAHHLFRKESRSLDWKTRYQIILGIARGLAYLHEECRECIIHCDIKPGNILLDSEDCPKLSDFGLAKLLGHDFSRVLTTIRGTIGYLAPEWIEGLPITPKADVYSFGMMLFEMVSGRRNSRWAEDGSIGFFPVTASSRVITGEVLSLLNENVDGCVDISELNRVCRVAYWCIQDSEVHRPSMAEVVKIFEGALNLEMPPFPATLRRLAEEDPMLGCSERI